jgi:hypothetical protein
MLANVVRIEPILVVKNDVFPFGYRRPDLQVFVVLVLTEIDIKIKLHLNHEFVIAGYTESESGRGNISARCLSAFTKVRGSNSPHESGASEFFTL